MSEQSVVAYFSSLAVSQEAPAWSRLVQDVTDVVEMGTGGEVDGPWDADEEQAVTAYGPSAEELWELMAPLLRAFTVRGGRVVLRFGEGDSAPTRTIRL